ncbi:uncharacterized protein LOC102680857 isoform X3 [Apis dorsata]|uniref:uncharacterized protein LOC102680857 isoform X3 n=1 Tax=Apis dorsata TaxID=7462 RepID=UPI0003DF7AD6|nr:uncharacterized protein LOC102680857 isoform X3 [Apis dorsata]
MYYIPMSLLPPCSFVVYRVVLRTFEKTSLRFFILNRTVIRRCDRSCLFLVDNTLYVCYYGNYKVKFVVKNAGYPRFQSILYRKSWKRLRATAIVCHVERKK